MCDRELVKHHQHVYQHQRHATLNLFCYAVPPLYGLDLSDYSYPRRCACQIVCTIKREHMSIGSSSSALRRAVNGPLRAFVWHIFTVRDEWQNRKRIYSFCAMGSVRWCGRKTYEDLGDSRLSSQDTKIHRWNWILDGKVKFREFSIYVLCTHAGAGVTSFELYGKLQFESGSLAACHARTNCIQHIRTLFIFAFAAAFQFVFVIITVSVCSLGWTVIEHSV